jgi:3-hydroxybutyryl-CoA dehydrogenase
MTIGTIGIIGTGTMGRGIAQIAAQAGLTVRLFDADGAAVEAACGFVGKMINRAVEKGRMEQAAAEQAIAKLVPAKNLKDFKDCDLVIEAIIEDLDIKQSLFKELEAIVTKDAILASNTSSLSISAIAAACENPSRVAGYHFFNPVPLMRLVEVIAGLRTANSVIEALVALTEKMGHTPVRVIDSPGFLVNHAGRGFGTEALRILAEGIADVPTIDLILRDGVGFRMGPFELLDTTGLDVSHPVMEQIYHQFYEEARFRPQPITGRQVAAGLLGRKSGEGFYDYDEAGKRIEQPPSLPEGGTTPRSVCFEEGVDEEVNGLLRDELAAANVTFVESPQEADICVVLPIGDDCTMATFIKGLPAPKYVAVDPIRGFDGAPIFSRIACVMTNPATDMAMAKGFADLLNRPGRPCVMIQDSPGFVAQRVLAQIVNIGCDIAQQGIASPEDIDTAVELGLGYRLGPLKLGDHLGRNKVVEILDGLIGFYGDERYRKSAWLKRRALLNMSLTQSKAKKS